MFSLITAPSTSVIFSAYTTFTASSMLVRTVLNDVQNIASQILPSAVQEKMLSILRGLMGNRLHQITLVIDQYSGLVLNDIYVSSEAYLSTIIPPSVGQLKAFKGFNDTDISLSINKGEKFIDVFEGIEVVWEIVSVESQTTSFDCETLFCSEQVERKSFVLNFNRKDKEIVLRSYLPYIMEKWKAMKEQKQVLKLYSVGSFYGDTNLDHPFTFDTLAMDPMLKQEVMDDLDRFVRRRDYYRRVGKAWKRGYLLYGPPGTGKSSMIAAMANYLKFDIYELELTSLRNNADLKRTLLSTANKSILVIEDIDCSAELKNRQDEDYSQNDQKLTLSGLLNFIDGLWSSCGDERIIVFTTNHKNRLDPALLRPGRMDVHIHMSYCTPSGFTILASNYLGITNHILFSKIEKLVAEVEATPAEIAEQLMKSEAADVSLGGLVKFLEDKKIASSEATAGGGKVEDADCNGTGNDEITKETQKKRAKNGKNYKRKRKNRN